MLCYILQRTDACLATNQLIMRIFPGNYSPHIQERPVLDRVAHGNGREMMT